jgi:flagellar protein FlgJ
MGLSPEALLAQAALETGWGRHVMSRNGGGSSHNLFGIKADSSWDGDRVRQTTLEFKDGVALKTKAAFRAYDSYGQSLSDYVRFIQSNPRYSRALEAVGDERRYFRELQRAGYATDPNYAEKIEQILDSDAMQRFRQSDAEPSVRSDAV